MKKILFIAIVLLMWIGQTGLLAQEKYFTRDGKVSFYSKAPVENIEAHNNAATSVLDTETGRMEYEVLIKNFLFEKSLMQEHFNENYMESDKYPKSTFKGQIVNTDEVNFQKDGTYPVNVKGKLTIHGVTNPLKTDGKIFIEDGEISAEASFKVTVADYEIEIPAVVRDNIAKVVRVDVEFDYQSMDGS